MSLKRSVLAALACLAVVTAMAAAGCTNPSSTATAGAGGPQAGGSAVTISNFAFDPSSITVKPGTTVTWTNQDAAPHTVTADDGSWDSGEIAQGKTYSHMFATAGTYAYHCSVHPSMKATVVVAP